MPGFCHGKSPYFGSRSQSSGDCAQDVSLCNQQDLGASWAISPRSLASLPPLSRLSPASLPPLSASNCLSQPQFDPLDLNPVCLRCRHSASEGALIPGVRSQLGRHHALRAPCLTPISRHRRFRLASGRLIQSLPTSLCLKRPLSPLAPGHERGVFPLPEVARLLRGPAPSGNEPAQLPRRWHRLPGSRPAGTSAGAAGLRSCRRHPVQSA